jgi:DNA-directed RNA polymerase subunit RPC12/RpoP
MSGLIDKSDLLKRLRDLRWNCNIPEINEETKQLKDFTTSILNSATNDIVRIIEDTPEITTRQGYWKAVTESEISGWDISLTGGYDPIALYVCSECGEDNIIDEFGENFLPKYCPFCGARLMNNYMDDGNDE